MVEASSSVEAISKGRVDCCRLSFSAFTARIAALSESLKLVGFYPAGPAGEGAPEIERAVTPGFENRHFALAVAVPSRRRSRS